MEETRPVELESHLGYWLRRVSNRVSYEFARALSERGVTVAEWVALCHLNKSPLSPSALAEATSMTQGAVSKVVDKLQAKGWLDVRESEEDRRGRVLSLTGAGRGALPGLAAIADENDRRFFGPLTDAERNLLRRVLERLSEIHAVNDVPTD